MKTSDFSAISRTLSHKDLRGPEYQNLFRVLNRRKDELCSWNQIVQLALNGADSMQLEPLLARGMFCDGFDFPKDAQRDQKAIEKILDTFDLHVHNINLHSSQDYAFVQLDEEGHNLSNIIESLRKLFDSQALDQVGYHYMELPPNLALTGTVSHLLKIDLTQDFAGFFYISEDEMEVRETLRKHLSRLLGMDLSTNRNSFASCIYFEEPKIPQT